MKKFKEKKKIFNGIPLKFNFWDEFSFKELTINQRQKDDPIYAKILNRIRVGNPTLEDIDILKQKILPLTKSSNKIENAARHYIELSNKHKNLICLLPTTESVEKFNSIMNELLEIKLHSIKAVDSNQNSKLKFKEPNYKKKRNLKAKKIKTSKSAGLEHELNLGINSRIILRRNIDVPKGLCNGALGTVKGFTFEKNDNTIVESIVIKFDCLNEDYYLKRIVADYEYQRNVYVSRSQFPISLAWALTIHKTQGLSLDAVIIDLGYQIFEPGMAYVALSRARKLDNVYLIDFDPSKIICNPNCINEYNRLYKKYKKNPIIIDKFNTIQTTILEKLSKRKFTKDLINDQEVLENPIKNLKKLKPNDTNCSNFTNPTDNFFLKLQNINNACFSNVILQLFLTLGSSFFEKVLNCIT